MAVAVGVRVGIGRGVGVRVASALIVVRYTPYGSVAGGAITLELCGISVTGGIGVTGGVPSPALLMLAISSGMSSARRFIY